MMSPRKFNKSTDNQPTTSRRHSSRLRHYYDDQPTVDDHDRPPSTSQSEIASSISRRSRRRTTHHNAVFDNLRERTPPTSKKLKKALIYNGHRPAELFRTDFITAMKVNESDVNLDRDEYIEIQDPWRQEWNHGVQIPVDVDTMPTVDCHRVSSTSPRHHFKHTHRTYLYSSDHHKLVDTFKQSDNVCRYDLDDVDVAWLRLVNARRIGDSIDAISEDTMEIIIEKLENDCYESLQTMLHAPAMHNRVVGREFDENAACDICQSGDVDDDDAIVFCDGCDLCVHQSCYGVAKLPIGSWLCRSCTLSPAKIPQCVLCPNSGGALKCTKSGGRWAHVTCVLWIPEMQFGDPETLEPVINLGKVPEGRYQLRCSVCDKKQGACIQCCVKHCHTAYHVTCAQRNHHTMTIEPCATEDGVRMISYCEKHSQAGHNAVWDNNGDDIADERRPTPPNSKPKSRDNTPVSVSGGSLTNNAVDEFTPRKRRARRLAQLEQYFYTHVNVDAIAAALKIDIDVVLDVHEYWKLRRASNANRPLLTPKDDEDGLLERYEQEAVIRRVRMLVGVRQNLEKARNLCYMVERREKIKKQYLLSVYAMSTALITALDTNAHMISQREIDRIIGTLKPSNIYDSMPPDVSNGPDGEQESDATRNNDNDSQRTVVADTPQLMEHTTATSPKRRYQSLSSSTAAAATVVEQNDYPKRLRNRQVAYLLQKNFKKPPTASTPAMLKIRL